MRYTIGFIGVSASQSHSADLFCTNSLDTARAWFEMGFRVWDNVGGRQIHTEHCFHF
jgi:hypothetical protein